MRERRLKAEAAEAAVRECCCFVLVRADLHSFLVLQVTEENGPAKEKAAEQMDFRNVLGQGGRGRGRGRGRGMRGGGQEKGGGVANGSGGKSAAAASE